MPGTREVGWRRRSFSQLTEPQCTPRGKQHLSWYRSGMAAVICSSSSSVAGRIVTTRLGSPAPRMWAELASMRRSSAADPRMVCSSE